MRLLALANGSQDLVLNGPLLPALLVAAAAGLVSFFSPCCLPLVPGYLSYVAGTAGDDVRVAGQALPASRTVVGAVLFVSGFAVVFTSYGALFGALGGFLITYQEPILRASGAVTILLGLVFAGVLWRIPIVGTGFKPAYRPRLGLLGAPVLGATFAIGWTPCIGPTLAAVLALSTTNATAGRGALLTFVYSLGLGIPFLVAAVSVRGTTRRFEWARRHVRAVARTGGALLIGIGVLQVTGAWSNLLIQMQVLLAGWQSPL